VAGAEGNAGETHYPWVGSLPVKKLKLEKKFDAV